MFLYRLFATLLFPVVLVVFILRWLRGRESSTDLGQRLGRGSGMNGAIWLHGASNGELISAQGLVRALQAACPDRPMVITTNTVSGRDLVAGWGLDRVTARLAPLDFRWALAQFRAAWRPAVLIVLENELWPNRIATSSGPVIFIAARLSARSAARWGRLGALRRSVIGRIDYLSAQDTASHDRFAALGVDPARLGPVLTLKRGVDLPAPPAGELAALAQVFTRAETVLAASTHTGEDAAILTAFATARARRPDLKLILTPRHPRRAAEIARLIDNAGLRFATRSKSEPPDHGTAVYLADTLGEMALWYALAGATFVGGSLVDKGGHTPFEPVLAGSAVLHGPHVANFTAIYAALDGACAAIPVTGAQDLARAFDELADPARQSEVANKARLVLAETDPGAGALDRVVQDIARLLGPVRA